MTKIISFLCVLVLSLFFTVSYCFAEVIRNELNNDFSEESKPNNIKKKTIDKNNMPKASNEDIFGDEQAFPFIAGLGKNAAH